MSRLARCNRQYHRVSIPYLYRTLKMCVGFRGADKSSLRMIQALRDMPQRRRMLRNINVFNSSDDRLDTCPSLNNVTSTLAPLLSDTPDKSLRSFIWNVRAVAKLEIHFMRYLPRDIGILRVRSDIIEHDVHFPSLSGLTCSRIWSVADVDWVKWHVAQNRLCSLALSVAPRMDKPEISLDTVFESFLHHNHSRMALKSLSLTLRNEEANLINFLTHLNQTTHLAHLSLLTSGVDKPLPILHVLPFQSSLKCLVLESRSKASDPSSVHVYSAQCFASIICACTRLERLSIPVSLDRNLRSYWVSILSPHCHGILH